MKKMRFFLWGGGNIDAENFELKKEIKEYN
jgi:hypothetical protein